MVTSDCAELFFLARSSYDDLNECATSQFCLFAVMFLFIHSSFCTIVHFLFLLSSFSIFFCLFHSHMYVFIA